VVFKSIKGFWKPMYFTGRISVKRVTNNSFEDLKLRNAMDKSTVLRRVATATRNPTQRGGGGWWGFLGGWWGGGGGGLGVFCLVGGEI